MPQSKQGYRPTLSRIELNAFLSGVERRAYGMALVATRNEHDALDIVQTAMLSLCERYADRPAEEWPLLFQRILQNAIRDHFRRSKVRNGWIKLMAPFRDPDSEAPQESLDSLPASVDASRQPEREAESRQVLAAIEAAISRLPPRQREAFVLRYWEGLDVAETASVMGCSEGSVKTHCFRAVEALGSKLREQGITL